MIEQLEALQRAVRLCNDVNVLNDLVQGYKVILQAFTDGVGVEMDLEQAVDTVALLDDVAMSMQARLMVLRSDNVQRLNILSF